MHRFSSRSAESADLTRRATEAPASVLYGTLRRPTERNAVRTSDLGDAVENLCIIRARNEEWIGNRKPGGLRTLCLISLGSISH